MREVISQNPYSTNETDYKINASNGAEDYDALIVKKFESYLTKKYSNLKPSQEMLQYAT